MPAQVPLSGHFWLLDVCDDLLDYCDTHDLQHTSDRLRYVMIALLQDVEGLGPDQSQRH